MIVTIHLTPFNSVPQFFVFLSILTVSPQVSQYLLFLSQFLKSCRWVRLSVLSLKIREVSSLHDCEEKFENVT